MKKLLTITWIFFLILLNYFYPYTLLTKIKLYSYSEITINKENWISIVLKPQKTESLIIPFLFKKVIYSSPYEYNFSIFWNFKKIENVKWYFLIDNKAILIENFTLQDTSWFSGNWNNVIYFRSNNEKLDILWNENKNIKFILEFTWIEEWKNVFYKREVELKPDFQEWLWNQFLWNLESI